MFQNPEYFIFNWNELKNNIGILNYNESDSIYPTKYGFLK